MSQEQGLLSKQMMRRKTKKRFNILPEEAVLHVFDGQLDKGVKFSPETSFVAFFNSSFFTILARRSHLVSCFITNITSETRHLQQWFNITDTRTNTLLSDLAWYEVHKHEPNRTLKPTKCPILEARMSRSFNTASVLSALNETLKRRCSELGISPVCAIVLSLF